MIALASDIPPSNPLINIKIISGMIFGMSVRLPIALTIQIAREQAINAKGKGKRGSGSEPFPLFSP